MRTFAFALGLSALLVTGAEAESFTFVSKVTRGEELQFPDSAATPALAMTQKGTMTSTLADGSKTTGDVRSMVWTTGSADMQLGGLVEIKEPDGTWAISFNGRNAASGPQSGDGWGRLSGISGKYKGKTGAGSWSFSETGGVSTIDGSGHWDQ
ncbi:MAG TPA: hypothetical protein VHL34_19830 [Rhizomicrobium sp.]|jgi:hypothetical protein|nr:hypothetical protein [Rhizomicrobium sp.]